MSRKRYLSSEISTDARVAELGVKAGLFGPLLYTWLIPAAQDDSTFTSSADDLLLQVVPGLALRMGITSQDVQVALDAMLELRLIEPHDEPCRLRFPAKSFYKYQRYVDKDRRTRTEEVALFPEFPGNAQEPAQNPPSLTPTFKSSPTGTPTGESASRTHAREDGQENGHLRVLGEPVPKPKPKHPPVDEEYVAEMAERFAAQLGGAEHVRDAIDQALNHKAHTKYEDQRRYVLNWLKKDAEQRRERQSWATRQNAPPGRTSRTAPYMGDEQDRRELGALGIDLLTGKMIPA